MVHQGKKAAALAQPRDNGRFASKKASPLSRSSSKILGSGGIGSPAKRTPTGPSLENLGSGSGTRGTDESSFSHRHLPRGETKADHDSSTARGTKSAWEDINFQSGIPEEQQNAVEPGAKPTQKPPPEATSDKLGAKVNARSHARSAQPHAHEFGDDVSSAGQSDHDGAATTGRAPDASSTKEALAKLKALRDDLALTIELERDGDLDFARELCTSIRDQCLILWSTPGLTKTVALASQKVMRTCNDTIDRIKEVAYEAKLEGKVNESARLVPATIHTKPSASETTAHDAHCHEAGLKPRLSYFD